MAALQDRIGSLLTTRLGVPEDAIGPDATFDDMAIDSLVLMELTLMMTREFGVRLMDDELRPDFTIEDAAAVLESKGVRG